MSRKQGGSSETSFAAGDRGETRTALKTVQLNGQDPLASVLAKNLARRHTQSSEST
jgi:hypothetical protein